MRQVGIHTPVLLITFNRPAETAQVLARLREVRPTQLFVANDGPRAHRPDDPERCTEVRRLVTEGVDWPCELKTLFQEGNLGCRDGVSTAISWFFSQVDEGIILEDDIVPEPSFFPYQEELLERYRHDERVMCVAGHQVFGQQEWPESYRFSQFATIWGWGTWKRVWERFEPRVDSYFEPGAPERLRKLLKKPQLVDWWDGSLRIVASGRHDTWDVQFCYVLLKSGGVCVVPRENHVRNIGFSSDATHTKTTEDRRALLPSTPVSFPLVHPRHLRADRQFDRRVARDQFWNRHVTLRWKMFQALKVVAKKLLARAERQP